MITFYIVFAFAAIIALILVALSIFIVKQWEKAAVLRFGRIIKIVESGLNFKVPVIDSVRKVDLRTQTVDLMGQSAITKDNISVGIDAVGGDPGCDRRRRCPAFLDWLDRARDLRQR